MNKVVNKLKIEEGLNKLIKLTNFLLNISYLL